MTERTTDLSRRRMLLGGAALGAGVLLAGCTSNDSGNDDDGGQVKDNNAGANPNNAPGKNIKMTFSAPAADHGWIRAITDNARKQAEKFSDVQFNLVEAGADVAAQRGAIETAISAKPDVLVLLPHDGAQMTSTGRKAMEAGIPVVNLDREFSEALAYTLLIKGDNYGMGVAAGHYIGKAMKAKNIASPIIGEIAGMDELPLTQDRSRGFKDALKLYNFSVTRRVAARFTVPTGQEQTANLLSAAPQIDAMWNHDDDQGVGVLQAIKQANRKEFFLVGGAGSLDAMEHIKSGDTPLECTVTYSPTMASTAISLARLVAQNRKMDDIVELQVPKLIILQSETITKENVDTYMPLGFRS